MNEKAFLDLCAKHGVMFVNRSYGKATTQTVTLEAMKKIVEDCFREFFKPGVEKPLFR